MELSEQEIIADIERRQREAAAEAPATITVAKLLRAPPKALTAEEIALRDAEIAERERRRQQQLLTERWTEFIGIRGARYKTATLSNFTATEQKQIDAIAALTEYRDTMATRLAEGEGVVLFGPKGTGKDHLLVALARAAIIAGFRVTWQNGMDLFGEMRDRIDSQDSERAFVNRFIYPDVLYLSDPVPPIGSLTDFQAAMMFRILDGRYSRRKPTWCSVNVSKGSELDARMGSQNVDRLRHGALSIHCDWPSYRAVAKHVTAQELPRKESTQ